MPLQSASRDKLDKAPRQQVLAFPGCAHVCMRNPQKTELSREDRELLHLLRSFLSASRLTIDGDPHRACALISADPRASAERYAIALFRTLPGAARRRLTFYCGACDDASVDEMWLLRLLRAYQNEDDVSAAALIGFRIRPESRRFVRFFASGLARMLAELYPVPTQ